MLVLAKCGDFAVLEDIENRVEYPLLLFREEGSHHAFTDLAFFNNKWYLTFRKSDKHVRGKDGSILIYSSDNFIQWNNEKEYFVPGVDLRDPDFFVWNDQLKIKLHGSIYDADKLVGFREYVSNLSLEGNWGNAQLVEAPHESWLWKFFTIENRLLSLGYNPDISSIPINSVVSLFEIHDQEAVRLCDLPLTGYHNEGIIREINGKSIAVIRNEYGNLFVGEINLENCELTSYNFPMDIKGGMNIAILNSNSIKIVGRVNQKTKPSIISVDYSFTDQAIVNIDSIESGGDCGYPGIVHTDSVTYLSYYSTHYGNAIFLNKLFPK
ncbi:MAG: hypothetical protein JXQ96_04315 [Cyclobacteriaceae bacterium]